MMVTAYGDDERRRRARELGAVEFVTKPVDFDRLKAQLGNCLPLRLERIRPRCRSPPTEHRTAAVAMTPQL